MNPRGHSMALVALQLLDFHAPLYARLATFVL